jgi:hypothetical protein
MIYMYRQTLDACQQIIMNTDKLAGFKSHTYAGALCVSTLRLIPNMRVPANMFVEGSTGYV